MVGGVSSWRGVGGRELAGGRPRKAGSWLRMLGTISFMTPDAWGELQAIPVKVCRNKAPIHFVFKLTGCLQCVAKRKNHCMGERNIDGAGKRGNDGSRRAERRFLAKRESRVVCGSRCW